MIANDAPDIIMSTKVIPKAQIDSIQDPIMKIEGFKTFTNFEFIDDVYSIDKQLLHSRKQILHWVSSRRRLQLSTMKLSTIL